MTNGFFAGGAAEGLTAGIATGSEAVGRGLKLGQGARALQLKEQEAQQTQRFKELQLVSKNIKSVEDSILKEVFEGRADPEQSKALYQRFAQGNAANFAALGQDPQSAVARVSGMIDAQLTAGQQGTREGIKEGRKSVGKALIEREAGFGEMVPETPGTEDAKRIADAALAMSDRNLSAEQIGVALDAMAGLNPGLAGVVESIKDALPKTPGAAGRAAGERDVGEADAKIERLVAEGLPRQTAAALVLGRAGAQFALDPTRLSAREVADIRRNQVALARSVGQATQVRETINDKVIGVWGAVARTGGGLIQQFKLGRAIANTPAGRALGIDAKTVEEAQTFFSRFARLVEFLKPIVERGDRFSNQDREAVRRAAGMVDSLETTPEAARQTLQELIDLAEGIQEENAAILESQGFGGARRQGQPDFSVRQKGGNLEILDADGNVIDTLEPVR